MFRNRPGQTPEEKFTELEKTLGIENLQDVEVDEENALLYVYTENKKFKIVMTEV